MNADERQVIDDLFDKLDRVAREAPPRDPDAESHINARIAGNPGATYLMAQTLVAQQHALEEAYHRMQDLERQLEERPSGGFLDGLFGSARPRGRGHGGERAYAPARAGHAGGYGSALGPQGRGSFLGGAAQTAMGVAGGVVLGSMLASMLAPDAAAAAEPEADPGADEGFDSADSGGDDFSF